ncbi:MAG: hypothetical protein IJ794_15945 [Lachnospiraceae bacterium]|nr:hypothetical protein [Lachnospiraceae bacterium]
MVQHRTPKEILEKARSGRAISPAYVEQNVKDFLRLSDTDIWGPCSDSEEELEDMVSLFQNTLCAGPKDHRYIDMARSCYRTKKGDEEWIVDDFAQLVFLGYEGKFRFPFLQLTVEDYLKLAGLEELYERWFARDAEAWMREHGGKAPKIREVLKEGWEILCATLNTAIGVKPNAAERVELAVEDISQPFRREEEKTDMYEEQFLMVKWAWILMVEAPCKWGEKLGM